MQWRQQSYPRPYAGQTKGEYGSIGPVRFTSEPITPAEAGALSDAAYGNPAHEVERTLARIPSDRVQARGRRDPAGQIVTAAVALDVDDDCSIQYVATRPDAQRRGHALALLTDMLARARTRGVSTTSLQSSEAGARLYRHLGYRTVATLELRCRPRSLT